MKTNDLQNIQRNGGESWRADAAEQIIRELKIQNMELKEMLQKVYDHTSDCDCPVSEETVSLYSEIRNQLHHLIPIQ